MLEFWYENDDMLAHFCAKEYRHKKANCISFLLVTRVNMNLFPYDYYAIPYFFPLNDCIKLYYRK